MREIKSLFFAVVVPFLCSFTEHVRHQTQYDRQMSLAVVIDRLCFARIKRASEMHNMQRANVTLTCPVPCEITIRQAQVPEWFNGSVC
jgi:hypothetical protein